MEDELAVTRARLMRGYDSLLRAKLSSLQLHYAARLAGLMVTSPRERQAAVAALIQERDAALARLRDEMAQSRTSQLAGLRRTRRRRRYRVRAGPSRPARPAGSWTRYPSP